MAKRRKKCNNFHIIYVKYEYEEEEVKKIL